MAKLTDEEFEAAVQDALDSIPDEFLDELDNVAFMLADEPDEEDWPQLLPALELAYNCTPHSSTGLSPFEVMIGENPVRSQDLDVVESFPPLPAPQMTKAFRLLVDRAAAHLEQAKSQQKAYADKARRPLEFAPGDSVWVSTGYMAPYKALL